jgi:hypothetical protein
LTYPDDSDGWVASGFPPPKFSLAGQKNVKLLLIPVNFADKKIDNKTYESAKETVKRAENFYSFNSYERVNFKFEVLSLEQGVNLTDKVSEYEKTWANKNTDVTQFLLDRAKYSGTELVDAIMWLFPLGKYRIDQMPFDPKYKTYTFNGQVLPASRVYGLHVELNSIGAHGFDHGAGHALYSFEDLYLGAHNSTTGKIEQPGNGWDVMIGGGEFFGWSRWLASWLLDSEVYCVFDSNKPVVVYLKALQDPAGKKLLAMRINDGKVVLAEYRTNTPKYISTKYQVCLDKKFTPCNYQYHHSGVLLYNLDTSRKHSGAPYRVAMETDEKLLSVGENLKYENVIFSVLAADSEGIYLQAKKID